MWIVLTAFLCSVAFCTATRQEYGLCSQVYLMSQYCSSNHIRPVADVRVARGPAGKPGLPGIVNYTIVGNKIAAKIKEVEKTFEAKFEAYETIMNRTITNLEEKSKKLDSQIAEYEAFLNKTRHGKPGTMLPAIGCHEAKLENAEVKSGTGGVFKIDPSGISEITVFCDLTTDSGGWTVFQRRVDGSQDFSQDWNNYVAGFGDLTGEFWLGLEKLHLMTQDGEYELRVELTDNNGRIGIAKYQTFSISGSSKNYKLNVGGFSGTGVTDRLTWHNNMDFTTKDRDNDKWSGNCAVSYGRGGGWWFNNCRYSTLNHAYGSIYWRGFNNIKKTEMKFRKK